MSKKRAKSAKPSKSSSKERDNRMAGDAAEALSSMDFGDGAATPEEVAMITDELAADEEDTDFDGEE